MFRLFIVPFLISFGGFSPSFGEALIIDRIDGEMECTIKGGSHLTIFEGRSDTIKMREIGDKVSFKYKFWIEDTEFLRTEDRKLNFSLMIDGTINHYAEFFGDDLSYSSEIETFAYKNSIDFLRMNTEEIWGYNGVSFFQFKRYYQSDWDGFYSSMDLFSNGVVSQTLDCRHIKDSVFEIMEQYKLNHN
jgi:hypothetical protein